MPSRQSISLRQEALRKIASLSATSARANHNEQQNASRLYDALGSSDSAGSGATPLVNGVSGHHASLAKTPMVRRATIAVGTHLTNW